MTSMTLDFLRGEIRTQTSASAPRGYDRQRRHDTQLLDSLPLPYTMMILQQPIFDLLRVIFKADSIDKQVFALGS